MATFRVQKREAYVVLDKGFLNNPNLSWQAKGLLAYMLSLPNDWVFNIRDLSGRSKNGRDATRSTVDELVSAGYIDKQQHRAERGKFGNVEWIVNELPFTENPTTVNPATVNPDTDNPFTENPSLLINKELNNKKLNNNLDNKDKDAAVKTAFSFYEENGFGTLSSYIAEKIGSWIDDLNEEIVVYAMQLALENNVRKWNYVETVLKDWSNKKFKTVSDIEAERLRYETMKKQKQSPAANKQGHKEVVPEWFHKRNEKNESQEVLNNADLEERRNRILADLGQE